LSQFNGEKGKIFKKRNMLKNHEKNGDCVIFQEILLLKKKFTKAL
jgi:hypothetical protein